MTELLNNDIKELNWDAISDEDQTPVNATEKDFGKFVYAWDNDKDVRYLGILREYTPELEKPYRVIVVNIQNGKVSALRFKNAAVSKIQD